MTKGPVTSSNRFCYIWRSDAVGQQPLFGMHHTEPNLECPVGRGIQPALGHVYGEIEYVIRLELRATSVADVLRQSMQAR